MRQILRLRASISHFQSDNEPEVTVSESPNAAMTLISAAFTSSTGGRRQQSESDGADGGI